jgi:hypothetical protein
MTPNEISHYESLKKQDTANRKLIKKLQLDKQALKEQLILSGVSKSLPCKKCNDNGGFATMEGWETCTNCL